MRLVTRCPACATTFKVVRDQLRISDGWVRCGRCSEVFDATLDLQETDDDGVPLTAAGTAAAHGAGVQQANEDQPSPAGQVPPSGPLPPPATHALPAMTWPAADLLELGGRPPVAPAAAPAAARTSGAAEPPPASTFDPDDDPVPVPSLGDGDDDGRQDPWFEDMMASTQALQAALQSASAAVEPGAAAPPDAQRGKDAAFTPSLTTPSPIEEAVNAQVQKALRRERIKALRQERAAQKERERVQRESAAAQEPSPSQEGPSAPEREAAMPEAPLLEAPSEPAGFVDDAGADAFAGKGRRRQRLLASACVLALLALLLQVVRHERDALAAREPRLRPALESLCDLTGCQLSALRQIGSITIEGASFSREKEGDGYRLVFTLRNGARMPLAMPSIELTLLDTQERALVRRVLSPAQFGAAPVLAAGAESNTSLPVQLGGSEAAGLGPVAGYNLVAFYP